MPQLVRAEGTATKEEPRARRVGARWWAGALAALLVGALVGQAAAQGGGDEGEGARAEAAPRFWLNIYAPNQRAFTEAIVEGQAALRGGQAHSALVAFERAVRLQPGSRQALLLAGMAATRADAHARAIALLERLRALDPEADRTFDLCFMLAVSQAHLERWEATLVEYDRCLESAPEGSDQQVIYLSNRAEVLMAVGDLEGAVAGYRAALDRAPGNMYALLGLGVALARRGDEDEARRRLRQGLLQDPGLEVLRGPDVFFVPPGDEHFHLGLIFEELGRPGLARARYERHLRESPTNPYLAQTRARREALEGRRSPLLEAYPAPSTDVMAAAVDPALRWLAVGTRAGRVAMIDLATLRPIEGPAQTSSVIDLGFTQGGDELRVLLSDGSVARFDVRRGALRPRGRFTLGDAGAFGATRQVNTLSADAGHAVVSVTHGRERRFEVWALGAARPVDEVSFDLSALEASVFMGAVDPEARRLFISQAYRTLSMELGAGERTATASVQVEGIIDLEALPGGELVALATEHGVTLLDRAGLPRQLLMPPPGAAVQGVSVDPSGRYLVSVLRTTIIVWDLSRLMLSEAPAAP